MSTPSIDFENAIPVVGAPDVAAAMSYYVDALGFKIDWGGEPGGHVGSVSRDRSTIMFTSAATPSLATIWIGVSDVAALHDQLVAKGVTIVTPPRNRHWALEMYALDLNGHTLWFGSGPLEDQPFA